MVVPVRLPLGFGFLAVVPTGAFFILLLAALALGDLLQAVLVMGAFGAMRAVPLWVVAECVQREKKFGPHAAVDRLGRLHPYRDGMAISQPAMVALALGVSFRRHLLLRNGS